MAGVWLVLGVFAWCAAGGVRLVCMHSVWLVAAVSGWWAAGGGCVCMVCGCWLQGVVGVRLGIESESKVEDRRGFEQLTELN